MFYKKKNELTFLFLKIILKHAHLKYKNVTCKNNAILKIIMMINEKISFWKCNEYAKIDFKTRITNAIEINPQMNKYGSCKYGIFVLNENNVNKADKSHMDWIIKNGKSKLYSITNVKKDLISKYFSSPPIKFVNVKINECDKKIISKITNEQKIDWIVKILQQNKFPKHLWFVVVGISDKSIVSFWPIT